MIASVTQAEANVLTIARTAVGLVPASDVMRLLVTSSEAPTKLGPTARRLLSDTLARGTVLCLARQGGWAPDPGHPTAGRLWERSQPPALEFTGNLVRLFQWVLRTPMGEADSAQLSTRGELTVAEAVVATLLLDRLRGTGCEGVLANQQVLRNSPLVVLAHTVELARQGPLDAFDTFDLDALGLPIEALRELLVRSWLAGEKAKKDIDSPAVLNRIGVAQKWVLEAFLKSVEAAHRRELATFLIDVAAAYLQTPRTPDDLIRSMSTDATLRERTEARRAAGALFRVIGTLREWDQQHRSIRFIDDGYDVAQALVRDWERLGERGFSAAAMLVTALDSL